MSKCGIRWSVYGIAAIAGAALMGCGSAPTPQAPVTAASPAEVQSPNVAGTSAEDRVPSVASSPKNLERLQALWDARSQGTSTDYPIGIGDLLQISVAGVDDFKERTVRVGSEGNIDLPLIGTIHAAGIPESQLRDNLAKALEKYMYDPQVDLFVKEYKSRQVAVVGAVRAPGLITLSGTGESILDVLTQAGGKTAGAAGEVVSPPQGRSARLKLARGAPAEARS